MGKLPGKRSIISPEEFKNLVDNEEDRGVAMLYVMLYLTGARITEVLELTREKVTFTDDGIMMVEIASRKRGNTALIFSHLLPINMTNTAEGIKPYMRALADHIKASPAPTERMWKFTARTAQRHLRTVSRKLNIVPAAWPHLFRHTRLTRLARGGCSAAQLQTWAGWTNLKYASTYVQQSPEMLKGLVID
jgi:site-specific recombinase XerD